jgi:signal peptidase I
MPARLDVRAMGRNKRNRMRRAISRRPRSNGTAARQESGGSLLRFLLTLVVLAWLLRSFIVAPFSIPSGSMLPTLFVGDYLMVAKWPYGYSRYSFLFGFPSFDGRILEQLPKRGDVVVFRHPTEDADLIKRVIGLPGDVIEVRDGVFMLNGKAIPREKLAPFRMPVSANSPCKTVPPALPVETDGACDYPAFRETLPGGPRLPDGRQSRRQPRQPFPGRGRRDRDGSNRPSHRPGDGHLLVDRRKRILSEAMDLVHGPALKPHRQ